MQNPRVAVSVIRPGADFLLFPSFNFAQLKSFELRWRPSFVDYRTVFAFPTAAECLMFYLSFVNYRTIFVHSDHCSRWNVGNVVRATFDTVSAAC